MIMLRASSTESVDRSSVSIYNMDIGAVLCKAFEGSVVMNMNIGTVSAYAFRVVRTISTGFESHASLLGHTSVDGVWKSKTQYFPLLV